MKLRTTPSGLIVHDAERGRWVALPEEGDLLAFLAEGAPARARAAAAMPGAEAVDPGTAGLPFRPRSLRAFMLWEDHVIASSRMLVKNFFPSAAWKAVSTYERVTGRTFPKLKPNARFRSAPTFYVANHTSILADGQDMWWPSHTKALDFELELACVLARPLSDATPEEALEAVGGWLVLNDWSARDVQADDARHNVFGPVVKGKTFANSIGCDVLTADALPDWTAATGRVRVDGDQWCSGTTAGPQHDLGAMLAYASAGERLDAGDVISTGTMPGCCGLEIDRWIMVGQRSSSRALKLIAARSPRRGSCGRPEAPRPRAACAGSAPGRRRACCRARPAARRARPTDQRGAPDDLAAGTRSASAERGRRR
jgi:2-keto-4-pentenoate hydratase/2-oxohepta-3-ene-1,7-dioic acid hydratase in catechol pathway